MYVRRGICKCNVPCIGTNTKIILCLINNIAAKAIEIVLFQEFIEAVDCFESCYAREGKTIRAGTDYMTMLLMKLLLNNVMLTIEVRKELPMDWIRNNI